MNIKLRGKKARMTYPDGTIHEVEFVRYHPIKIGDLYCYIGEYYDYTSSSYMITLLTEVDGIWYKIPLNDEAYDYLSFYASSHMDRACQAADYDSLGDIALAMPMTMLPPDPYAKQAKYRKPQLCLNYYVPINTNGVSNVKGTTFRSGGCTIKNNGTSDSFYNYHKTFNNRIIDPYLTAGITRNHLNKHGVKEYDFSVEIPPQTYGEKTIYLSDGTARVVRALCIPGVYSCKAFYSDFLLPSDYREARRSDKITIHANTDDYEDLHDVDTAWRDGGTGKLNMVFDEPYETSLNLKR